MDDILKEIEAIEREIQELKKRDRDKQDKIQDLIIQKQIELSNTDLFTFVRVMWKYAGTRGAFKSNWYIEAICEHLQALYNLDFHKLAIEISPRHGKSTIAGVIFPSWIWIVESSFAIINSSYGIDLSRRDALKSRQLMQSIFFQEHWGHLFKFSGDTNRQDRYENDKGGYRLATSVEGKGTGEGADLLIVDDPHKAKEFDSVAKKREVINWYTGTMQSRYREALKFREMLIHQRGADDDLIGYMTRLEDGEWCRLKIPVEYIPTTYVSMIGWKDPRTKEGDWLDEDRLPRELGLKIKLNKPKVWASQYQQEPTGLGGGYLNEEYINWYNNINRPPLVDFVFTSSIDLADGSSASEDVSNTCFQVWGLLKNSPRKKYLLEQYRGLMTFPEQIQTFEKMCAEYPNLKTHLIELKSNGRAFIDQINANIVNRERPIYNQIASHKLIEILPRDYGGNKNNRFEACIPEFIVGNVYLPTRETKVWIDIVLNEILKIPNVSERDCADCVSQLINYMVRFPTLEDFSVSTITGADYSEPVGNEIKTLFEYTEDKDDFREYWNSVFESPYED